jgi:outer membrane cobalamin receptor
LLSNQFLYNEGVHALYAQYRQSLGKFGFQAGLRGEYATNESELKNTGEKYDNDYYSVFPSAFVTWKPEQKLQVKASYSRRINRPRTGQLNPFTSYEDPLNIRKGNPELDPEYTDSYELEGMYYFSKMTLTTTVYYRYIHDYIQRYRTFDPESGVATVTFENINSSQNLGLEVILNANLYKWWSFTVSGNFYQNILDAANLEQDLGSNDISMSGRIFTTFKMPYSTELQISYSYRAPFEVPQGEMKDMQMMNLAASKKVFKDRGTITFRVSDPLNISRFGISLEDPLYTQDISRRRDNTTFTLGFTYRFGELKEQKQRDRAPREEMPDMGF